MLELVGVRHRYEGRVVLDIERFAVAPGAGVAIVGPNGSGKSTLLRLLALLERPSEGEVRLGGVVVAGGKVGRAGAAVRRSSDRCCYAAQSVKIWSSDYRCEGSDAWR